MIVAIKKFIFPISLGFVYFGLYLLLPEIAIRSSHFTWEYFKEMAFILPPVFILMGLMEVWIPKYKIQKWLGNNSGIRGAALSFALGTLPTGPLYVAFPMASSLLRKGASISNIIIFLGSWAALKIPQLMVEIKFLGLSFAVVRFFLTLAALILIGSFMKFFLERYPDQSWLDNDNSE